MVHLQYCITKLRRTPKQKVMRAWNMQSFFLCGSELCSRANIMVTDKVSAVQLNYYLEATTTAMSKEVKTGLRNGVQ